MTCPKCGGDSRVYQTHTDGPIVFRYRKCKECGWSFKSAEMSFSTLNQADIADVDSLERRLKHINRKRENDRKISLSPREIVYGKSEE